MLSGVGFKFIYFHLLSFCMTCEQLLEFLIYIFFLYLLVRSFSILVKLSSIKFWIFSE